MNFYGAGCPRVDEIIHENYFKDYPGGFFVECGAFDGVGASCCKFFEETLRWKGINVEASAVEFPKLLVNRPDSMNVRFAMGSRDEMQVTFTEVIPTEGLAGIGNSSMSHSDLHKLELDQQHCAYKQFKVPTITWDTLSRWMPPTVDLFVLDVEGAELEVISGMTTLLPHVICVEYPHAGLGKLVEALAQKGYAMDFVAVNNAFFSLPVVPRPRRPAFGETKPMAWDGKEWKSL